MSREDLLERAVDYVETNGWADTSLRALGEAIGTSHRMLIHHFGSKEGLMTAIVDTVETRTRAEMTRLADRRHDPVANLRAMWRHLITRANEPHERLFFELYGQALQGREGTDRFMEFAMEPWIAAASAIEEARGVPRRVARARARLGLALTRGLLLDVLTTGDRAGATAALEEFMALIPASSPPRQRARQKGDGLSPERQRTRPARPAPPRSRRTLPR